jgi:hypothetical protein
MTNISFTRIASFSPTKRVTARGFGPEPFIQSEDQLPRQPANRAEYRGSNSYGYHGDNNHVLHGDRVHSVRSWFAQLALDAVCLVWWLSMIGIAALAVSSPALLFILLTMF